MDHPTPKFQEEYSAKIPALALLSNLGWTFLSPKQALVARGGKISEVILRDALRNELKKRRFTFAGGEHALSDKSIDKIITEVCSPSLNEGLKTANEKLYNHLLYGISVTERVNGKKANPTIALIDWYTIDNNSFLFTEEFTVGCSNGFQTRSPDIVCFVNGIPLVVIEAKRPDGHAQKGPTVEEGISQHIRNQRTNEIPLLFVYSQLLLSISSIDGCYGTQGTKSEFWAVWREEDIADHELHRLKNQLLSPHQEDALLAHRQPAIREWYTKLIASGELAVTDQDRILIGLLSRQRLLDMIRYYIFFDKKHGKIIARYPQVFSIKRLIECLSHKRHDGKHEGGVIWHTTGSGKSFTMVFLSKALIFQQTLKQCRILVVTDRVDLEDQLSRTFISGGELSLKKNKHAVMATSGRGLATQIGSGTERIIFSLIQKFNNATKLPECYNTSADIIVLIDEGHRSQGGENHARMKHALPNAAFIAFTGTPLLKEDKTTNKFGSIIHAYTMQRAVEDKAVLPLLYEERVPDLEVNERAIDRWFERITEGISEKQRIDLKKKFSKKGKIYQSEDRIRLIALDIANHFSKHIMPLGLKGQIACDTKLSAIKYKQFLDEAGLFESAVVMSPPDTREGNSDVDESTIPIIAKWWQETVVSQSEVAYTKRVIERFDNDEQLKLLIVVDKLLTGFDEPKNTVLYIDKSLKEHNLIQAIARVNRLYENKDFGFLIAYRGVLKELDTTIAKYQDLANRTQGGFDIEDIIGLYSQMSTEYKRLPSLYNTLWSSFKHVKNKHDLQQLRQVLIPRMEEINGEMVDVNINVREDFYQAFTAFNRCLKIALQSATFFADTSFSDSDRDHYKETSQQFYSLRQIIKNDASETVEYKHYAEPIKKLIDKHVVCVEIRESKGVYHVSKMGLRKNIQEWSEDKLRNETDIIRTRVTKMIEQDLQDDPYAKEAFSKLLRQAIKDAELLFEHPMKQYLLFTEFEQRVAERQLDELPNDFKGNRSAQAYFGLFRKFLPAAFSVMDKQEQDKWFTLSFTFDNLIKTAVIENSLNLPNIEAAVRKKLLPLMLNECKAIGAGLDQARKIIESIVQIIRINWSTS